MTPLFPQEGCVLYQMIVVLVRHHERSGIRYCKEGSNVKLNILTEQSVETKHTTWRAVSFNPVPFAMIAAGSRTEELELFVSHDDMGADHCPTTVGCRRQ